MRIMSKGTAGHASYGWNTELAVPASTCEFQSLIGTGQRVKRGMRP